MNNERRIIHKGDVYIHKFVNGFCDHRIDLVLGVSKEYIRVLVMIERGRMEIYTWPPPAAAYLEDSWTLVR